MNEERHNYKVGLALGGGTARGLAHLGVLQVFAEQGVPVDLVAGTSVGSLVGALFAAGLDPWLMDRAAHQLQWRNLVRLRLRRDGLLDTEGLERFIIGHIGDLEFSDLKLPFAAVATDIMSGQEVVMTEGRVASAVRASCALPGVFLPERRNGQLLVDGGLVSSVPTSLCRRMGADYVIAVELNRTQRSPEAPRNLVHLILYSIAIMQQPQVERCLAQADAVIQPDLSRFGYLDIDRVQEMVAAGRDAATAAVPQIQADLAALAEPQGERPAAHELGQAPFVAPPPEFPTGLAEQSAS